VLPPISGLSPAHDHEDMEGEKEKKASAFGN